MNFKNVKNYTEKKLQENEAYYPAEIFQGVSVSVNSGSFGRCLLTIKHPNYKMFSFNMEYVGNYKGIDHLVYEFVHRNYERLAFDVWDQLQTEKKKGTRGHLSIYRDGVLVNEIFFNDPLKIKNELIKILMADKKRGVKTIYKPIPYSNNLKIIQKFNTAETSGANYKYVYEFLNIEY